MKRSEVSIKALKEIGDDNEKIPTFFLIQWKDDKEEFSFESSNLLEAMQAFLNRID